MNEDLVGRVVDGRYRVTSNLARGGMATVYEATDLRLHRTVALKVMHPHLAADPGFVARFEREARSAAQLSHPHVVAVYDQGFDAGIAYLAMEHVPGRTLRDVLAEFGPLSAEQALVILDPVLDALAAAHTAGFVHRDIKPENVLIADDGRVKVADFGLARAVASTEGATTGMIIGTVAYLSPEQVERGEADGRSDVYSTGVMLFEMVTGQVPHTGESPLSVAYRHVNEDVPAPSSVRPGLPPEIDALVVAATRRDPALRYPDAAAFRTDVRRIKAKLPAPRPLAAGQPDLRETLVVPSGSARPPASVRAETSSDPHPRKRRRWPVVVALVLILAVAAAGLGGWYLAVGRQAQVPDLVGLTVAEAEAKAGDLGLTVRVAGQEYSATVDTGEVLSSSPVAGEGIDAQGEVALVVSKGPEVFEVPPLKGTTVDEAESALSALGLRIGRTSEEFDSKVPEGEVIASDPKAGFEAEAGSAVDLVVSKGPEPVPVPDVAGQDAATARSALVDAGLEVQRERAYSEEVPDGSVIRTRPKPGVVIDAGTTVVMVVSQGPPPVVVPNLVDMPKAKAVQALEALGLVPKVQEGDFTPLDRVITQSPAAGESVPRGSTVTIRIT